MEKRVELALLMDFYGPLLTEKRRDVMRLYCDEDMGLQEIADQLDISRQGVYDAVKTASAALERYEEAPPMVQQKVMEEAKKSMTDDEE